MNWIKDHWFARYHARHLTPEFKEWWITMYGTPEELENDEAEEVHEYWIRCAFAWIGWKAFENLHTKKTEEA